MPATVVLDFDPTASPFGVTLRLETLAIAGTVLVMLVLAALVAGRAEAPAERRPLRRDDLLYIAFGSIPGSIVGGRLGYCLIHLDYYRAHPSAIADPSQGGATLTFAILLGSVGAIAVARLLAAPVGRWLGVAAVPLLVGLGLGKLAMVLGGDGQGRFAQSDFSTRYVHSGAWLSTNADVAAIASQAIEGVLVLAAAAAIVMLPVLLRFRARRWWRIARPGWSPRREWWLLTGPRRFLVALLAWAAVRFGAATTWRDATVFAGLRAEQLILAGLAAAGVAVLLVSAAFHLRAVPARRRAQGDTATESVRPA